MKLTDITKGSEIELSLYTSEQTQKLEARISERSTKKDR